MCVHRFAQQPNDGAWNLINQRLNLPQSLSAWAVLSFADGLSMEIAGQFAGHLENCCRKLGRRLFQCNLHRTHLAF